MPKRKHIALVLTAISLCLAATDTMGNGSNGNNRNMLRTNKLDTLKLSERVNLRVNALGWLLQSPNFGIEYTLGSHNYSHWTIGINGRTKWATQKKDAPYVRHYLDEARLELRRYWHGHGLTRSFFAGMYGGYTAFDLKLTDTGYWGKGYIGGLTAGTIAPLYGYRNGSSIDLEVSVNAGVLWADITEYTCNDGSKYYLPGGEGYTDKYYLQTASSNGRRLVWNALPYAAANDVVRLSFVYHFGPSVADRYRRRITIDDNYRYRQNELALLRDSTEQARKQEKQQRKDSLKMADYEKRFEKQRLELERRHKRDSVERVKQRQHAERRLQKETQQEKHEK